MKAARLLGKLPSFSLVALGAVVAAAAAYVRHRRRFDLAGKNVVLTGGARGLGLEVGRVLVEKGADVAIVARDEAEIARGIAALERARRNPHVRVIGRRCDLRDADETQSMIESVRAELGPIDVLVNNAGAIQVGPLDSMTIDDFRAGMELHCFAPLRTMLAVRDDMRRRGGGRIANIASIGGVVSVPHLLPYSASKFALVGLSQGMRAELAREGILVSTIAPGLMRTGSPRNASFKGDHRAEYAWFAVADSLPLLSVSSRRAALRIVRAIEHGEPHVIIGGVAKLASLANGIAPGLVTRALTLTTRFLPRGSDARERPGHASESSLAPSLLTVLTDRAALRNNEV